MVVEADGSGRRLLQREPLDDTLAQVGAPAWSPDGGRILYTRTTLDRRYRFRPALYTMDAEGRGARLLAADAGERRLVARRQPHRVRLRARPQRDLVRLGRVLLQRRALRDGRRRHRSRSGSPKAAATRARRRGRRTAGASRSRATATRATSHPGRATRSTRSGPTERASPGSPTGRRTATTRHGAHGSAGASGPGGCGATRRPAARGAGPARPQSLQEQPGVLARASATETSSSAGRTPTAPAARSAPTSSTTTTAPATWSAHALAGCRFRCNRSARAAPPPTASTSTATGRACGTAGC